MTWSLALEAHNFLSYLQFFKIGKIICAKCRHLTLPVIFSDKVIPDIDFTDEAVLQCDMPVVK